MDEESLTEILSGRHFSVPERIERGLWPHAPLRLKDVIAHLSALIQTRPWFPKAFRPARSGELVADVTAIEHQKNGEYVVHYQRSSYSLLLHGASGSHRFKEPEDAAAFFLKIEFNLPGDLDGWKVIE